MNRNLRLLTLCQGLFLTNNVTFIADQRPGRPGAGAAGLDGDAAGHRLCGRRRALRPGWSRGPSGAAAASARSRLGLVVALLSALLCAYAASQPQLLAAVRGDPGGRLLQRQRRPVPLRRGRAGGSPAPEKAVSLGAWPAACWARWPARTSPRARGTCSPAPFAGAYLALAAVALLALVLSRSSSSRRCAGPSAAPAAAGRWRRSCASRCSSSPPWPARSATA